MPICTAQTCRDVSRRMGNARLRPEADQAQRSRSLLARYLQCRRSRRCSGCLFARHKRVVTSRGGWAMPGFDLKQIKRNDQVILGAGILFLLLSFFAPFYGVSFHGAGGLGGSASVTAWHSYGFLAVLLIIIAVAIVAVRVLGNASLPALPIGPNLLVVVVSGLGTLLLLLRGFTYKSA